MIEAKEQKYFKQDFESDGMMGRGLMKLYEGIN